jgi:hypothetical protein
MRYDEPRLAALRSAHAALRSERGASLTMTM